MIRNCLMCVHCSYSGGEHGYSEWTPGTDALLYCDKGIMRHARRANLFFEAYTRQQLREALTTAETCPKFTPDPTP